MLDTESSISLKIPSTMSGVRVDKAIATLLPEYSRSAIQSWISQGMVCLDNHPIRQKQKLSGTEILEITVLENVSVESEPENIPLEVIFEDHQILVINKPAGLVVHPGAGNAQGTLLNGLLFHDPDLARLPRAGIVHRLDKDTTGIMVVARTEKARQHLINQLETRSMKRQYIAVTEGMMISGETINQPIGRHRYNRLKMCVTASGKPAITHFRVLKKFRAHTLVQANLESGRTHQIRVHLSWRGYALVGDSIYGSRNRIPPSADSVLISALQNFNRQALHAQTLTLLHPDSDTAISWSTALPDDLDQLIGLLDIDTVP